MELQNLTTQFIGRKIFYYPKIDSTQLEVWRRVEGKKIESGTIIMAGIQTEGKRYSW